MNIIDEAMEKVRWNDDQNTETVRAAIEYAVRRCAQVARLKCDMTPCKTYIEEQILRAAGLEER